MIDSELKDVWLEKVKHKHRDNIFDKNKSLMSFTVNTFLYSAPEEIQKDYDVNLQAALIGEEYLWNIHKDLRKDKSFILNLIQNNYKRHIYAYLSNDLKNDVEIFKACISRKDEFDWGISKSIIENRELMVESMKEYDIYGKIKSHYELDKEIAALHLQHNPSEFPNLKKSVKNYFSSPKRKDFIIDLFKKVSSPRNLNVMYQELPLELQENLEIIDAFLSKDPYNMQYLSPSLKEDKAFTLYAIDKYGTKVISESLQKDRDVIEALVSKNGENLKLFNHFKDDLEMLDVALKTYDKIDILSNTMLYNKDVVLKFLKANPSNSVKLLERTQEWVDDYEIMKLSVEFKGGLLKYSKKLKNDPELSEIALAGTGDFNLISQEHLKKKNLVLQLLDDHNNCKKAIDNNDFLALYRNHRDIAEKIVIADPANISHFPALKADKEFVKLAIKNGLKDIQAIDSSLYSDKEIAIKFCQLSLSNYGRLPLSMKNDHDVALAALQAAYYYPSIASSSNLSDDIEFTFKAIKKFSLVYNEIKDILPTKTDSKVILCYIESCNAKSEEIKIPRSVMENYGASNIDELKSLIVKEHLEESLPAKGTIEKKLKI